jgi:hypothetical protein
MDGAVVLLLTDRTESIGADSRAEFMTLRADCMVEPSRAEFM